MAPGQAGNTTPHLTSPTHPYIPVASPQVITETQPATGLPQALARPPAKPHHFLPTHPTPNLKEPLSKRHPRSNSLMPHRTR